MIGKIKTLPLEIDRRREPSQAQRPARGGHGTASAGRAAGTDRIAALIYFGFVAVIAWPSVLFGQPPAAENNVVVVQLERLRVAAELRAVYDRAAQFGSWRQSGGGCLDVRGQVLAIEAVAAVGRSAETAAGRCRVVRGQWQDPYTGTAIEGARQVDVDHVVPLKEAWESGAAGWTRERRRAYANDLTHPDTLLAVSAAANRAKGDKDPAQWLPPAAGFRCRYLEMWVGIKARWDLAVDPAEKRAIATGLGACD